MTKHLSAGLINAALRGRLRKTKCGRTTLACRVTPLLDDVTCRDCILLWMLDAGLANEALTREESSG